MRSTVSITLENRGAHEYSSGERENPNRKKILLYPTLYPQVVELPTLDPTKWADGDAPSQGEGEGGSGGTSNEFGEKRGWNLRLLFSLEKAERTRTRLLVTEVLSEIMEEIIDIIPEKVRVPCAGFVLSFTYVRMAPSFLFCFLFSFFRSNLASTLLFCVLQKTCSPIIPSSSPPPNVNLVVLSR